MEHRTDPTEQRNAEMHRRVATRIRCEPGVIAETKERLLLDEHLGRDSSHAAESFVHVQPVTATSPFLPAGWEQRLIPFGPDHPHLRCLEIHDLVLSRLTPGRLTNYELIAVLLDGKLADLVSMHERISAVLDLRMSTMLAARLQIVIEGGPR